MAAIARHVPASALDALDCGEVERMMERLVWIMVSGEEAARIGDAPRVRIRGGAAYFGIVARGGAVAILGWEDARALGLTVPDLARMAAARILPARGAAS